MVDQEYWRSDNDVEGGGREMGVESRCGLCMSVY